MKKEEILVGMAILIGFTTFGWINQTDKKIDPSCLQESFALNVDSGDYNIGLESYGLQSNTLNKKVSYRVQGRYERPIIVEQTKTANTLSDLISGYPSNWVSDYLFVQLTFMENGEITQLKSENDTLTNAQKIRLSNSSLSDEIQVLIGYKSQNKITKEIEVKKVSWQLTIIPNTQAKFKGNDDGLNSYFTHLIGKKITMNEINDQPAVLYFEVDENGKASQARIDTPSGNPEIDALLIDAVLQMPKWTAAKDGSGKSVPQNFKLIVGYDGC